MLDAETMDMDEKIDFIAKLLVTEDVRSATFCARIMLNLGMVPVGEYSGV